jgi:hypothetical protein
MRAVTKRCRAVPGGCRDESSDARALLVLLQPLLKSA